MPLSRVTPFSRARSGFASTRRALSLNITRNTSNPERESMEMDLAIHNLHHACFHGLLDKVKELHAQGVSLNARCAAGHSPLCSATMRGKVKIIKYLIQNGADVNECDNKDLCAIYFAVHREKPRAASVLLQSRADADAHLTDGKGIIFLRSFAPERTMPPPPQTAAAAEHALGSSACGRARNARMPALAQALSNGSAVSPVPTVPKTAPSPPPPQPRAQHAPPTPPPLPAIAAHVQTMLTSCVFVAAALSARP